MENPALTRLTDMPPALVAAIQDDPAVLQPIARAMGAINMHNLFKQVSHPDATVAHRVEFQKLVNKIGQLEPETKAASAGFVFNINLGGDKQVTVVAEPQAVEGEFTQVECDECAEC